MTLHPAMSVRPSVPPSLRPSVSQLVPLLGSGPKGSMSCRTHEILGWLVNYLAFIAHRSCPCALVTISITTPPHQHANRVAVYLALSLLLLPCLTDDNSNNFPKKKEKRKNGEKGENYMLFHHALTTAAPPPTRKESFQKRSAWNFVEWYRFINLMLIFH